MFEEKTPHIMVYADCHNSHAKGDFQLACLIAHDLQRQLLERHSTVKVVLSTSETSMERLTSMYPQTGDGLHIRGMDIPVCTLQQFDMLNNSLIAFVDANRCKPAPSEIVLRVLEPETRYLFVHGPHRTSQKRNSPGWIIEMLQWMGSAPELFRLLHPDTLSIGACGLGSERYGLPDIDFPADGALTSAPELNDYGFMYFSKREPDKILAMVEQYMVLANLSRYVVVGPAGTIVAPDGVDTLPRATFSEKVFTTFSTVSNHDMRRLIKGAVSPLVVTTGTISTIEAMSDGKLSFYDYRGLNTGFVVNMIEAVRALNDNSRGEDITQLGMLLLGPKPLAPLHLDKTKELLSIQDVREGLINAQQNLVKQAQGRLAPRLLDIIGAAKDESLLARQHKIACLSLTRKDDSEPPKGGQAVRRAAFGNHLYALKIFLKYLPLTEVDSQGGPRERTALHFAALMGHEEAVILLLRKGANPWVKDIDGNTPIDLAATSKALSPEKCVHLADRMRTHAILTDTSASTSISTSTSTPTSQCGYESSCITQ